LSQKLSLTLTQNKLSAKTGESAATFIVLAPLQLFLVRYENPVGYMP